MPANSSRRLLHAAPLPASCFCVALEKKKHVRFGAAGGSGLFQPVGAAARALREQTLQPGGTSAADGRGTESQGSPKRRPVVPRGTQARAVQQPGKRKLSRGEQDLRRVPRARQGLGCVDTHLSHSALWQQYCWEEWEPSSPRSHTNRERCPPLSRAHCSSTARNVSCSEQGEEGTDHKQPLPACCC